MPVTIIPAAHQPKAHPAIKAAKSMDDFLHYSCPEVYLKGETRIVASSFEISGISSNGLYPSSSSFVRSAIEAWSRHSHLVLRPDDLWFTILVQLNFFMENNAESLRGLFVAHRAQVKLEIWASNWHEVVGGFSAELKRRVRTKWLSDWVSPGFSTSTKDDEMTATVLFMGLMKQYFDYAGGIICGIPSITLLGTRKDWQRLLEKLDHLDDFGAEPKAYAHRLRPILSRIVRTFDSATTTETKEFWNQMVQAKVRHTSVCDQPPTQYIVSGWILGFFYWDATGCVSQTFSEGSVLRGDPGLLQYDGVRYGEAPLEDVPVGYARAEFTMLNEHPGPTDEPWKGWVSAGNIGKSISDGAPKGYKAALARQRGAGRSEAADDRGDGSGCFYGLLRGLNCFGGQHKSSAEMLQDSSEKQAAEPVVESLHSNGGHSTIQPRSGWFLFGPARDPGPFVDTEEVDGPTVDAIDSCEGIEHYHAH